MRLLFQSSSWSSTSSSSLEKFCEPLLGSAPCPFCRVLPSSKSARSPNLDRPMFYLLCSLESSLLLPYSSLLILDERKLRTRLIVPARLCILSIPLLPLSSPFYLPLRSLWLEFCEFYLLRSYESTPAPRLPRTLTPGVL